MCIKRDFVVGLFHGVYVHGQVGRQYARPGQGDTDAPMIGQARRVQTVHRNQADPYVGIDLPS
jgi:hypothetical protein